ncbi:MBL fold metallo-hydrolase [Bacteroides sp. 51]|uniref:MBL fold metallo-hydrolase n=1 Tax=Bacteroides sp. 51 TaxID=2302938 RepID=UPI0013D74510|nr:MBL fold metallo-hydrolase [Bacteroides sp. 51]NDV83101.1 MBL fold metallo-hydrolase [Bacteroides sp. 51]
MNFKITTLVENTVYGKGLQGEHGLSLFVETPEHKVLFDTGASDLFIRNARLMHIDLSEADYLVLSHGHRDHTGGLHHFMEINKTAPIICKREAFVRKFKNDRENGIHHSENLDKSRFRFITEQTEIVPGVHVFPDIKIVDKHDTHFEQFYIEEESGIVTDTFEDELCVALKSEKAMSVISACSHRGITNMVRAVQEVFPSIPLQIVLGGFHIHETTAEKFNVISGFFGRNLPKRLGVCHCTGVEKYAMFRHQFNDRVYYNYTGWIEKI